MKRQVKLTAKIQCKVEQRTYKMLDGDPRVSDRWVLETFPVLAYVDHQIECVTKKAIGRTGKFKMQPVTIRHCPVTTDKAQSNLHEITCELPTIHVTGKDAHFLEQVLDYAIKRVADHVYVDGDFTLLEAFQLALEKEVNDVLSNLWGTDVNFVRAQVSGSGWVSVRLINKGEDSLLAFWIPENSVTIGSAKVIC